MKKVYLVWSSVFSAGLDDPVLIGVFSTKERAKDCIQSLDANTGCEASKLSWYEEQDLDPEG